MNLLNFFKGFFRKKVKNSKRHKMTMKEYLESVLTDSNTFDDNNENTFHYCIGSYDCGLVFRHYMDSGTVCEELDILDYTNNGYRYKNVKVEKIIFEKFLGNVVYFSYESKELYKKETPKKVLKELFSDGELITIEDYYLYKDDFKRLGYTFDVIDGKLHLREPK